MCHFSPCFFYVLLSLCRHLDNLKPRAKYFAGAKCRRFLVMVIDRSGFLNILGFRIDDKLSFKDHLSTVLRKVYAKVGALRRLRKLVPADISLMLYKAHILPHLEYCSPLPLGINTTLNKKLESANYYALKALLNFGNSLDYDSIWCAVNVQSLEHRRYYQSLVLLFKCIGNGPDYISDLLYYKASLLWNQLPSYIKRSTELSVYRNHLRSFSLTILRASCKCNFCIS